MSQYDLLRILKPFIGSKSKIAISGFRALTEQAKTLCEILEIPAFFLPIDNENEMPGRIDDAKKLEIACFIGDMVAVKSAVDLGIPLALIESGKDSVAEALDKTAIWPGNVRELENAAEKWVVLRRLMNSDEADKMVSDALMDNTVSLDPSGMNENAIGEAGAERMSDSVDDSFSEDVAVGGARKKFFSGSLDDIVSRAAKAVFEEEDRNVSRAARRLGIDRQTLRRRLGL